MYQLFESIIYYIYFMFLLVFIISSLGSRWYIVRRCWDASQSFSYKGMNFVCCFLLLQILLFFIHIKLQGVTIHNYKRLSD